MANATSWMNSTQLIAALKRKISFPIASATFSEQDLLDFANEEMMIGQVPAILEHHEEYFVSYVVVPLQSNKSRYAIPKRAIGDKLRDVFYADNQIIPGQDYGNLYEMTQIDAGQKAFFQQNAANPDVIQGFYLEGSDIVITPGANQSPTGSLVMYYFMRPNQLVPINRAATATAFLKNIEIDNASIADGDVLTIGEQQFTAVTGSPLSNEFLIGASSILTATNLVNAINSNGEYSASNGTPSTATVTVSYSIVTTDFSTVNEDAIIISPLQVVQFDSIPDNIANNTKIDFLQTPGAHKTYKFDILLSNSAISGNQITFSSGVVPDNFEIGDYICTAGECIIPQIPSDLHNGLAERSSARVLAAIGDQAGLQVTNAKIQDIISAENKMISNRVEGAAKKVNNTHSILRYGKWNGWRRNS